MIKFDVNQKALKSMATSRMETNSIHAAFNGRTKSTVEACGATHKEVVGNFPEPSHADFLKDMKDDEFKRKFERHMPKVGAFSHGLMEAIHFSFSDHYPLVLSPDTVWLTLAQGFAAHVNANAESLRKRFVSHEGKKLILLERDHFVKGSPDNDWQGCFSEFSDKIADHIGKKRDLVVSNFSTTDLVSRAASEVVLMDSMKSYFKYGVRTICGIPSITLLGEVADWKNIRTRAENLAEYELDWWIKPLLPVLDQLVAASEGNPDIKFFDSFYKVENMSGGPYASGWCNTLFPYVNSYKGDVVKNTYAEKWNDDRDWGGGHTLDAYPNGLSKVPFKWQVENTTYDMEFLGGFVGVHQDSETLAVQPSIGWAVRDQGTATEGPIDPDQDW